MLDEPGTAPWTLRRRQVGIAVGISVSKGLSKMVEQMSQGICSGRALEIGKGVKRASTIVE